jgi:hypothetical protein
LPDVIVANANPATSALHQASRTVPIAFTVVTDPVGEGFVQNFARPGGNITGFTNQPTEGAKFLELLSEIAPGVRRVSFMSGNTLTSAAIYRSAETAAPKFTVEISRSVVRDVADIEPVMSGLKKGGDGCLIIAGDPVMAIEAAVLPMLPIPKTLAAERLLRAGATETSTSQEFDTTKVSVPKHFGHSKVRKSKPGLSGSMSRNAIIAPHFGQRGFLITSANTTYPPNKQMHYWTRFAQILCSEGDECLEK